MLALMEKCYTDEEFRKLLKAASETKHNPLKVSLLISIGGRCGLRTTECCSLKRKDIDFESGVILVTTLKQRGTKKGVRRFVPIDEELVILLRAYIKQEKIRNPETYLFKKRREPKKHETRGGIAYMMERLTKKIKIPNKGFKGLRHYFCTANAPFMQPQELGAMTGHSNLNMIMEVYYHPNLAIIREKYKQALEASKERMNGRSR